MSNPDTSPITPPSVESGNPGLVRSLLNEYASDSPSSKQLVKDGYLNIDPQDLYSLVGEIARTEASWGGKTTDEASAEFPDPTPEIIASVVDGLIEIGRQENRGPNQMNLLQSLRRAVDKV